MIAVALFASQNSTLVIPPLFVSIAEDLDISVAVAGQLATATFATWAVSVVLCSPLSDSLGRRLMAITGLTILAATSIASAFAPNVEVMLALRLLAGLGGGMIPPNSVAAVSEVISPEKRAQAVGGLMAVNIFAIAISVPLFALLAEWHGWRVSVAASGLVLALALVLNLVWFPRDSTERIRDFSFAARYKALLSVRFFRAVVFVMVSQRMAYWAMVTFFAAFLIKTYGLSVGSVALPLAALAGAQIVGSYSAGFIAKNKEREALLAATTLVGGICGLIFFSISSGFWVAVALGSLGTGLLSIAFPTLVAMSTEYSGRSRATGIGLVGLGNQSGGAAGAAAAGALLASVGYGGVGFLCLGVTVFGALAAVLFMRQPRARAN